MRGTFGLIAACAVLGFAVGCQSGSDEPTGAQPQSATAQPTGEFQPKADESGAPTASGVGVEGVENPNGTNPGLGSKSGGG